MAAHRYWRLLILDNGSGDSVVAVDELDLRVNAAGSRLSVTGNGTASASSTYPGLYAAAGAFDNVDFTANPSANAWFCNSTSPFPHHLQWDFGPGNEKDINYCGIKNVSVGANAAANSVRRAVLLWSDDGVRFTHHIAIIDHPNTTGGYAAYERNAGDFEADVDELVGSGDEGNPIGLNMVIPDTLVVDVVFGGDGFISGDTKIDDEPVDVPVRRRVLLLVEPGWYAIRETWSKASDGSFVFEHLNRSLKYTTITYDHTHSYRAAVADNLTPTKMT